MTTGLNGLAITLSLAGDVPAGKVLFQLPAFVNDIAHASTGTVDQKTGTVTLPRVGAQRHRPAEAGALRHAAATRMLLAGRRPLARGG